MSLSRGERAINAWWERAPGERYWLDVSNREGWRERLAAPRTCGRHLDPWILQLITHVKHGDVVFHYDASQQAIAAWSVSQGSVEKRRLTWAPPGTRTHSGERTVPSWSIALRHSTPLEDPVPLYEIARVQWDLFPTLRALEDGAGTTLHYPFEMGSRQSTRPISGYVFKLPAVFVQSFPALARAAGSVARLLPGDPKAVRASRELAVHPLALSR